jgi:beta-galactosidase
MGAVNDAFHPGGTGEEMDVLGMNYTLGRIDESRKAFPNKPVFGSENNSAVATRDCTESDREGAHVLADCDKELVPWGATARENWRVVMERDDFAGSFIWTGFDYRGEPTPFDWPSCSSQFGVMDTCGFPKNAYYFHKAMYTSTPILHIFPHWNWEAGKTVCVTTVTNCDEVELLLNGRSLGRRQNNVFEQNEWEVAFEAGTLSAVGYRNGQAVVTAERKTAGTPVAVKLTADRAILQDNGQDTVPVRVCVVDKNGVEVPMADHLIEFKIEGDGFVRGVGNGDPNSHEAEHLPERHLFNGLCQVLVTADLGAKTLKLRAFSKGLISDEAVFEIEQVAAPLYMASKPNQAITGVQVSVSDQEEKPDPAKLYGDDDMNSFSPVELDSFFNSFKPSGFKKGWREYRIPVKLPQKMPEGKIPALEINCVLCDRAEFYVNGKPVLCIDPDYKVALTVPLTVEAGREFEVRALLLARADAPASGFSQGLSLSFIDMK